MTTSVLIVEDDHQLRHALARDLGTEGYRVQLAETVDEAIRVLESDQIDVLLTDLRMSGRDGIDLLQMSQQVSPNTRSLLMSAFATARDFQTAVDYGAVTVLCKPFSRTELLSAIQQAVDCGTGFRGSIHGLSLIDMLQMFHFARRSISVGIGGPKPASIHLQDGEVIHAEFGGDTGEQALRVLLETPSGLVNTAPLEPVPRTIHRSFDSLLLDLLREIDENSAPGLADSGEFAFAEPVAAPDDELDRELRDRCSAVARLLGPIPVVAVAFSRSSARSIVIHGEADAEGLAEPARELLAETAAATNSSDQGCAIVVREGLGLGLVWDSGDVGFAAVAELEDESDLGLFRAHFASIARCFHS